MGRFVSLHHHTTFSYQDGYGQPKDHVARAVDLEMPALFLTEHGNVTSHVKLEQAAKEAGIQPGFGCELYTGPEEKSRFKWHLTALAASQEGLRNLNKVVSLGWENFYYEPTVTGEHLAENQEGLIVLSGCSGSLLACDLLGGKGRPGHSPDMGAAIRTAERFRDLLGDRYYLEVQCFPELERTVTMNLAYAEISKKTGIPCVATTDVHYPLPEDNKMQVILHAVDRIGSRAKKGTTSSKNSFERQQQSWGYDIRLIDHKDKELVKRLVRCGFSKKEAWRAIDATAEIATRCKGVELPKLKELKYPCDKDAVEVFKDWIREGWKYRGLDKLRGKERKRYAERLRHEMDLIILQKFVDYFLVVSDLVKWCKDNGIGVGPARGSAAASLVCWLLRITEINPMLFPNLLFERFIDINRHDLPDIDLDIEAARRPDVREYLVDQYGEEKVGNIGTFTKYKGKNSLEDVAKVFSIPMGEVESVKDKLIERASGDLRGNATIEDTIAMFPDVAKVFEKYPDLRHAQRLEGNLRGFSVHAAGLVVANEPLTNSCAVYTRYDNNDNLIGSVLSIDKYDAEYINALKIDTLALTTIDVIGQCLKDIGMSWTELYALPLTDEKVYEGFRRNEVVGLFQFDGRAMRSVNREVKPDNFNEVCDINALSRPGPLHSGAAAEYIMVKHGKKKPLILHPIVAEITAHTNQQIVYQEQILQVVRRLGNFTWEEAALIRKLISKKQGEQAFNRMMSKFVDGAMANGMSEVNAHKVWKQLVTAGAYAFNAAHCVSYGMLAYWTMWLKQNHPLEYYCAALSKYDPKTKGFDLLKEIILSKGLKVLPPDPVLSQETWSYDKDAGGLRAGLLQVSGIGPKTSSLMVEYRQDFMQEALAIGNVADAEQFDWDNYIAVSGIGPKTMERVQEFIDDPDPFNVQRLGKAVGLVRRHLWEHGDEDGIPFPKHKSEDVPYEARRGEYVWCGTVTNINLKDIYELHRSRTGDELDPSTVRDPQYVNYAVITGEDETGPLVITVHRYGGQYERLKDIIWGIDKKRDILVVRGYKRNEYRRAIYAKEIWVVDPDKIAGGQA